MDTRSNIHKKSVKKNYIYNLIYQLFSLLTPLLVTPYISRVLGSSGVGQYSFTYSIATYFVLLGSLGFGYYAQREIARVQGDKAKQSIVFFEIVIARFISVAASFLIYSIIVLSGVFGETYTTLMWILSINILACLFDVNFLFQGNEEFGIIALRNILIKILGIILIFVFVKNESHVWLYALSQSFILILSNLSLWTRLPKMLIKVKMNDLNVKRHFIPTLRLFIPTIAISIYTVLDKTLIGVLVPETTIVNGTEKNVSDIENGYYDQSEKIVKMAMTVITSLGTVMIPRNSQSVASGHTDEFYKNVSSAIKFVFFLGVPIMFGILGVSSNFSPWFFGTGYDKVPLLMSILSPLVLLIGLSNVLGLQYLIPLKKDKKYTIAITTGAIINLFLNLILIPLFWSYGAAIATVSAELCITIAMFIFARKDIKMSTIMPSVWKYILSGSVMFAIVFVTQRCLSPSILNTIILIFEGTLSYFGLLILLKDTWLIAHLKSIKARMFRVTK